MSRWLGPLAVPWTGVLLSAWVYQTRLPPTAQVFSWSLLAVLLGVPVLSLGAGVGLRLGAKDATGPTGEAMILGVMVFGLAIHLAVLGDFLGAVPPVRSTVPWLTGALLVGLGLALPRLPPGDPMGVRAVGWLASDDAWRRGHRLVGRILLVVGAVLPWMGELTP